jgi:pimeloyl-ACP methyl ester carboxylesterase
VIAVDMRGHGESDKPDNGYNIQRLAKDVQDVLVSLNLTDVTLMGHSMGNSVIPNITLPTLVVGGRASVVPWKSQVWIQKQVRGSRIEIFEENEAGSHFMFMENPDKFNRIVREFIG